MDKCVHCGFCLSTCPSYLLLGQEMDSPRGRIYMMKAGVEGRDRPSATLVVEHFDTCLGCMACETACPSGVAYAPLIEETRAAIEQQHERPMGERLFRRLLFLLLPYPARLRAVRAAAGVRRTCCAAGRACSAAAAAAEQPHRRSRRTSRRARRVPERTPASGTRTAARRADDRLRAARVLRSRQRGDRPGAGRRRLRGAGAGRPGLLRRAGAALRP